MTDSPDTYPLPRPDPAPDRGPLDDTLYDLVETRIRRLLDADPVLATFDAIAEWVTTPGYRGCAFINSLAETSEIDDTHRTIIAAHKRDLVEHLSRLTTPDHPNAPSWFPAALAVIVDGAIVQCTIFASTDPLDAARSAVHRLLETIPT